MRVLYVILMLVAPVFSGETDVPGRWVGEKAPGQYVLNPAANAAFIDRVSDLEVVKTYRGPLAQAGVTGKLADQAMDMLCASHRRIQRLVLEHYWTHTGRMAATALPSWRADVRKEFAGQDSALESLIGAEAFAGMRRALVEAEIVKQIRPSDYPAGDVEPARGFLRKCLLGSGGLPLEDQSAGLKALETEADKLSAEGAKVFRGRWNAKSFPLFIGRPLVSVPGNESTIDPEKLK